MRPVFFRQLLDSISPPDHRHSHQSVDSASLPLIEADTLSTLVFLFCALLLLRGSLCTSVNDNPADARHLKETMSDWAAP